MKYIAHKTEEDGREQSLKEHLEKTAKRAGEFALPFMQKMAYQAGLIHDIGKYQPSFQKRINGYNIKVEHALCGAKEIKNLTNNSPASLAGLMMSYCIGGHHSGLPDGGSRYDSMDMSTLNGRLKRNSENYADYRQDITPNISGLEKFQDIFKDIKPNEMIQEYVYLTRYLFSCLTDADFLDTESFCGNYKEREKIEYSFEKALDKLNQKLQELQKLRAETQLQKARAVLQRQAYDNMDAKQSVFFLNMPTGSGKTLCSLKLALETAIKCGKKRIIYVIPYTSVIEQTAYAFEEILQESLPIVQHHSNYAFDGSNEKDDELVDNIRLMQATENWDAPLIVTTSVQFFQSLHGNRGRSLRKMHNMASSVIIIDEAHLLPLNYFQACINSLSFLSETLDSKIILMSATLPDYAELFKNLAYKDTAVCSLIKDKSDFGVFDKCTYSYIEKISDEALAEKAMSYRSALVVVNKRKSAGQLYKLLSAGGREGIYHLSTYMTPYDRKNTIAEIRKKLDNKEKIIVVSTSLIEAGVDLDFDTVFREITGLDSILQAGGRCNREGLRDKGEVFVFKLDEEIKGELGIRANITEGLFKRYSSVSEIECIEEYYNILLGTDKERLKKNTLQKTNPLSIPFRKYEEDFKIIPDETVGIVVKRDERSGKLIEDLKYRNTSAIRRELQKYTASVYRNEFKELFELGVLNDYGTGIYCLTNLNYYDEKIGILFEVNDENYIF